MERERLEVDVLFVGAGPACLAGALHLSRLIRKHNQKVSSGARSGKSLNDLTILVIEKGKEIGSHILSGAVVNPRGFEDLLEGMPQAKPPYESEVVDDALICLGKKKGYRSPITPPNLKNHGCQVASLGKLVRWMAELCEEYEVEVYPEFPAAELLIEEGKVLGVRIGDKGLDKDGNPKPNHEPGMDVLAKVTVLGEGVRGSWAMQAEKSLGLTTGRQPQVYAAGIKEIWQAPKEIRPGIVHHTLGYPLGTEEFGGGFIYTMQGNLVDLGFVVGLDYRNPRTDPHLLFQQFKAHPFVRQFIEGGKAVAYGAKAIPEGGLYSMPRPYADGLLIIGDSAGFLDAQRLKGIHLAIKSGMLAAETIVEALAAEDFSTEGLKGFQERFEESWAYDELWKVRNFRQSFQKGFWRGMFHAGLQFVSGGRGLSDPMPIKAGHEMMEKLSRHPHSGAAADFDGKLTFDKLDDV
ncbi:MAG: NAD(P)/FAD-dependent oxidoreductase, partial [Acidobacteriota bacterium]